MVDPALAAGPRARLPAPAASPTAAAGRLGTGDTTVNVGDVHVHTQATDAHGIARDFNDALVAQANRGLA
jgi:hypothetical protein